MQLFCNHDMTNTDTRNKWDVTWGRQSLCLEGGLVRDHLDPGDELLAPLPLARPAQGAKDGPEVRHGRGTAHQLPRSEHPLKARLNRPLPLPSRLLIQDLLTELELGPGKLLVSQEQHSDMIAVIFLKINYSAFRHTHKLIQHCRATATIRLAELLNSPQISSIIRLGLLSRLTKQPSRLRKALLSIPLTTLVQNKS